MRKNVLLFRPGNALGDAVFTTPIPKVLAERGEDVIVACEPHIQDVYKNNPHITDFIEVAPAHKWHEWQSTYKELETQFDHIYHTHGHVEVGLLYRTDIVWGSIPNTRERKKKAKGRNYQDEIFKNIGLEERGMLPEFYFTPEEEQSRKELREILDKNGKKLVLWHWDGSTNSKVLVWGPEYLKRTMKLFPDSIHYVYTDQKNLGAQIPQDERVLDALGKMSVRESLLAMSIADLVIGPESFIVNAAAAWDVPKILFLSHSTEENLAKYYKNCTCITPLSEVTCYPCYLIQIDFRRVYDPLKRSVAREFCRACNVWDPNFAYRNLGSKCCYYLPHDKVMDAISEALK